MRSQQMDPRRERSVFYTIVMECPMGQEQLVQPRCAQAVGGSDMEDVAQLVNVDLVEFHALRHKHEPQAHGVHGFEHGVVGEKQGAVRPHRISRCTR